MTKQLDRNELEMQAEMAVASLLIDFPQLEPTAVLKSVCRIMWTTGFDAGCRFAVEHVQEMIREG